MSILDVEIATAPTSSIVMAGDTIFDWMMTMMENEVDAMMILMPNEGSRFVRMDELAEILSMLSAEVRARREVESSSDA